MGDPTLHLLEPLTPPTLHPIRVLSVLKFLTFCSPWTSFCIDFHFVKHGTKTFLILLTDEFFGFVLSPLKFCAQGLTHLSLSWSWTEDIEAGITGSGPWSPGYRFLRMVATLRVSPTKWVTAVCTPVHSWAVQKEETVFSALLQSYVWLCFFLLLKGHLNHQLSHLPWGKFLSLTPSNQCWHVILIIEFLSLFLYGSGSQSLKTNLYVQAAPQIH